jgi:hypothetical protein
MSGNTPRERAVNLGKKAVYYPTVPLLGWTKSVETVVAGGPTVRWGAFAALVTVVWVFAFVIYRHAREAADDADDALDGVTDGVGGDPE